MHARLTLAAVTVLMLAACAGPQPLATPEQISAAERNGTLATLYNEARASLVGKDRNKAKHAPLFAQLDAIGRKLGAGLDDRLRGQMEQARLVNGMVPLTVLGDARAAADPMRTWDPARHDILLRDIARESAITEKAVREAEQRLAGIPAAAQRQQRDVLTELGQLSGETRYTDKRDAMLAALRAEYEEAFATDNFEKALALLDELPPEENVELTRIELQTRLFERRFHESLANDRPEVAYRLFQTLSDSPEFGQVKERITPIGNDMANYFVALGSNSVATGNMGDAWRWFTQARDVRARLGSRVEPVPEEKPFVTRVARGQEAARKESLWGVALGLLYTLGEFDPATPDLALHLRESEDAVNRRAIRSARIAPFSSAGGLADYSGVIATRITDHLFRQVPEDLRIIAVEGTDARVDYVVSGSIDEARVETDQQQVRKTSRVVTQRGVMTRNPRYDEWLKLSERDRQRVPQPPAQLPIDRQEDVTYTVTQLRKFGYFSVAFRVVEAGTGKVVFTDAVTVKRELSDEGNEGVELGQYVLPAKTAQLPTDIEILNQLAGEASVEIGKRLAAQFGDLEQRYADEARLAGSNGNAIEAAERYADAVAVGRRKQKDIAAWIVELKRYATASGYAR